MYFEQGLYLWALMIIPVFIALSIRTYRIGDRWRYLFARQRKPRTPYLVTTLILSLVLGALILSIARPRVQYEKTYFNRAGVRIAVGIDVSKSMLAEDVTFPEGGRRLFQVRNRLNRARYFVLKAISECHGENVGVYIFANRGIEIVPFTHDYGYCNYILKHINDHDITSPGSDLGDAIKTGISMVTAPGDTGAQAMVLFSDGEDINPDKSSLYEAAELAARKGIRIYTVGIGTGKMALIPIRKKNGSAISHYLLDEEGRLLKTRLEQDTLKKIADITGGEYFGANEPNAPRRLIAAVLKQAKTLAATRNVEPAWMDASPFLLMAALVLIVLELMANSGFVRGFSSSFRFWKGGERPSQQAVAQHARNQYSAMDTTGRKTNL